MTRSELKLIVEEVLREDKLVQEQMVPISKIDSIPELKKIRRFKIEELVNMGEMDEDLEKYAKDRMWELAQEVLKIDKRINKLQKLDEDEDTIVTTYP